MTRERRKQIQRTANILNWCSILFLIITVAMFALIITDALPIPSVEENRVLRGILVIMLLFMPLITALVSNMVSIDQTQKITEYKRHLRTKRYKHQTKLLWEAIDSGADGQVLKNIFNSMNNDGYWKVFANGVVTTYFKLKGSSEDQIKADQRMKDIYL